MSRHGLIICALIAVTATGCDASQGATGAIEDAQEDADANVSQGALPEGFKLPKGTQIANKTKIDQASGEGWVIQLDSTASVAELEQHFQAQAEAAGFTVTIATNNAGQRQLHGDRADGMQFDFAAAFYGGGRTGASLAIGRKR